LVQRCRILNKKENVGCKDFLFLKNHMHVTERKTPSSYQSLKELNILLVILKVLLFGVALALRIERLV
jgi:hypothetical protein